MQGFFCDCVENIRIKKHILKMKKNFTIIALIYNIEKGRRL